MSGCLSVRLDYIHNFQFSLYNLMIISIKKNLKGGARVTTTTNNEQQTTSNEHHRRS